MIPLIGGAIGLGESIYGGIEAHQANKKLDQLEKNAPKYTRPDEIKQYLEMAKTGANSGMPGQGYLNQNNQQATQGAVSKLEDSGQLDAGAIQKLYQQQLNANNALNYQQSQYHQGQIDRLNQAFGESAKYADQEFEYNVNAPWQRQMNRASNKYEAGQKMLGQGISDIGQSISAYGQTSGSGSSKSSSGSNNSSSPLGQDFSLMQMLA